MRSLPEQEARSFASRRSSSLARCSYSVAEGLPLPSSLAWIAGLLALLVIVS